MEKKLPVFVYGTLRRGFANYERILKGRTLAISKAQTVGKMFAVHGEGFPCLIPNGGDEITGELMYLNPKVYDQTLQRLDMLEGYRQDCEEDSMYLRRKKKVYDVTNGGYIEAWVYYWLGSYNHLIPVHCGDWLRYKDEITFSPRFYQSRKGDK